MGDTPTGRQFPRYALDATVELIADGQPALHGRTRDLSRGGLAANIAGDVARGARVMVRIALLLEAGHTSETLALPARVVWSTPLGGARQLGLAFFSLTESQAADLDLFVRFLEDGRDQPRAHASSSRFDVHDVE